MAELFDAPSAAFVFLMSTQEVQVAQDPEDEISSSYPSSQPHTVTNKPYHLINADTLLDDFDDDGLDDTSRNRSSWLRDDDEGDENSVKYSIWVMYALGLVSHMNITIFLPSGVRFLTQFIDECKGIDLDVGMRYYGHECLAHSSIYFALSISLFSLFQWLSAPLFQVLWKQLHPKSKLVFAVPLLLSIAGNVIYACSNGSAVYLVGRIVAGTGSSLTGVCFSYIMSVTSSDDRLEKIATYRVFCMVGVVLAPILAIILSFGEVDLGSLTLNGYNTPALAMCLLYIIGGIMVVFFLKDMPPPRLIRNADEDEYFFSPAVFFSLLLAFTVGALSATFEWMYGPLGGIKWNWGVAQTGVALLVSSLFVFPGVLSEKILKKNDRVSKLGDRFFVLLGLGLLPSGLLILWVAFQSHFPDGGDDFDDPNSMGDDGQVQHGGPSGGVGAGVLFVGGLITFIVFTWISSSLPAMLYSVVPPNARTKVMAMNTGMTLLGRFVGPAWASYTFSIENFEPDVMFMSMANLVGVCLFFALIFWQRIRPGAWTLSTSYSAPKDAEMEDYNDNSFS